MSDTTIINFPAELCELVQWVGYRIVQLDSQKKPTKVLYNPYGDYKASSTEPKTWGTFEAACAALERFGYHGKGFVFSEHDPFCGVDFDNCVVDGVIDPTVLAWVHRFDSYAEISISGTGVHVILRGVMPNGKGRKHTKRGIEMYDRGRYFTVSDRQIEGTPNTVNEAQEVLDDLFAELFPKAKPTPASTSHAPTGDIPADDQELLQRMFASRNGDKIRRLWDGDTNGHSKDHSSADLALCNFLAFWTGNDAARMDRMFRQSKLYRDKWDREDYRARTIKEAIADTREVYKGIGPKLLMKQTKADIAPLPGRPDAGTNGNGAHHIDDGEGIEFRTDLGNGRRFAKQYGNDVRYVEEWEWVVWNDKAWERDQTGKVMRLAKQTVLSIFDEAKAFMRLAERFQDKAKAAAEAGDEDAAEKATEQVSKLQKTARDINAWALKSQGASRLEAMVKLAKSEFPIPARPEDFDKNPWLFNCSNGTVNQRNGKLQPHRREDLITKLCPVEYDPAAKCPIWLKSLSRWMDGKQHMVDFLQRLTGYSLTGDVSEQKLPFLQGSGSNGKSTYIKTTLDVMGNDYATQAAPDLLTTTSNGSSRHPTEVADLRGMRLVASVEVEDGKKMAENLVKQLTGGDKLKARFMRQDFFAFEPTHKIMLVANHKPVITGTDHAIWRRVMLIPFTVEIGDDEKDPHLMEKLQAEYPGILAWAMQGCLDWQNGGLRIPDEVNAATSEYKVESDVLARFLDECTMRVSIESRADSLFKRYQKWCQGNGEAEINRTRFGLELTRRGYEKRTDKSTRRTFYLNLGIIEADEPVFASSRE